MSNTRESNAMSEIAAKVGSTKDIVKKLNRAFYKVPSNVSDTNRDFLKAVALDFNTARSIAKAIHLDISVSQMMQSADSVSKILSEMPRFKETAALHGQYVAIADPMIKKAREALLEKENFEQDARQFVQQDLHEKLAQLLSQLGKSTSDIKSAIDAMVAQEKNITPKIEKLEETVKVLRRTLEDLHKETFNLMPFAARASLQPPVGVTSERSPSGPAAPAA